MDNLINNIKQADGADSLLSMNSCRLCPRECGVNRNAGETGFCGEGSVMSAAKIMLHMWEEPCLTGISDAADKASADESALYAANADYNRIGYDKSKSGISEAPANKTDPLSHDSFTRDTFMHSHYPGDSFAQNPFHRVFDPQVPYPNDPSASARRCGCGAVFFSGCSLRCVYCQNMKISRGGGSRIYLSPEELADIMVNFQNSGAAVIDLVTPTHFSAGISEAVKLARSRGLKLPVVYNTGGYEKSEVIRSLKSTADIYLTDFKYGSEEAGDLSLAPDYAQAARNALVEMIKQHPAPVLDENGIMQSGVIVRHLVLPGMRRDSVKVLEMIRDAQDAAGGRVLLSLMRQYTPDFAPEGMKSLRRRVTTFEYRYVADAALEMGFDGYFQSKDSADRSYTPEF